MTSRKILIVDDDADLSEALIDQLSLYDEFELIHAKTATSGLQGAREGHIDLIIMDVGLPDMDGREAVKLLRKSGVRAPIIMLTGHDTDSDAILGLGGRRQRLCDQAVPLRGAPGAHPRASSPARAERGRDLLDRPLYFSSGGQNAARRRAAERSG